MTPQERLTVAANALTNYNPDNIDAIEDMEPEDLAKISSDFGLKDKDYPKLIGTMIYIRKRLIEKQGRVSSFKAAFPERSVATATEHQLETFGCSVKIGEELHKSTIDIKAKRLENSQLYIHVYQLLQNNLYISYAIDRMKVLDEALDKSLDPMVADRDKPQYMKIFLEETRKPEGAKQLEFNMNITNNDVSVISIEEKMTAISTKIEGATAAEIIEMVHQPREIADDS